MCVDCELFCDAVWFVCLNLRVVFVCVWWFNVCVRCEFIL